jgi:hypothetical protein
MEHRNFEAVAARVLDRITGGREGGATASLLMNTTTQISAPVERMLACIIISWLTTSKWSAWAASRSNAQTRDALAPDHVWTLRPW